MWTKRWRNSSVLKVQQYKVVLILQKTLDSTSMPISYLLQWWCTMSPPLTFLLICSFLLYSSTRQIFNKIFHKCRHKSRYVCIHCTKEQQAQLELGANHQYFFVISQNLSNHMTLIKIVTQSETDFSTSLVFLLIYIDHFCVKCNFSRYRDVNFFSQKDGWKEK